MGVLWEIQGKYQANKWVGLKSSSCTVVFEFWSKMPDFKRYSLTKWRYYLRVSLDRQTAAPPSSLLGLTYSHRPPIPDLISPKPLKSPILSLFFSLPPSFGLFSSLLIPKQVLIIFLLDIYTTMWYLHQKSNKKDQTAPMKSEELIWDFEKAVLR